MSLIACYFACLAVSLAAAFLRMAGQTACRRRRASRMYSPEPAASAELIASAAWRGTADWEARFRADRPSARWAEPAVLLTGLVAVVDLTACDTPAFDWALVSEGRFEWGAEEASRPEADDGLARFTRRAREAAREMPTELYGLTIGEAVILSAAAAHDHGWFA